MGSKVWLYILSSNYRYYYVGITCNLVKRLKDHLNGNGAICTALWFYNTIEAVYCIGDKDKDYDDERYVHSQEDRELEKLLTLKMMKLKGYGYVRGEPYTCLRHKEESYYEKLMRELESTERPMTCECGMPVHEDISKKGKPYWKCPRKRNEFMEDYYPDEYDIPDSCEFFTMKYDPFTIKEVIEDDI